ncbi:hypothetical protein NQ317_004051 [Molorchus minor]|uniref:Uncharacterized protein n=1 Tax=Molorchus minor TaxID=1323400 RepID=A0ABQ9IWJ2_9CUCU|nr:hypothetical protein NQ317_004051 [Molorchus minor]
MVFEKKAEKRRGVTFGGSFLAKGDDAPLRGVLGIVFLIFGFLTLIGSLIYCVIICKDVKRPSEVNPDDLKNIGSSEIHYKGEEKYGDDRYSDRYSVSKLSGKYSDRNGNGRY